jgi:predicted permease
MNGMLQDLRWAVRALAKSPGFTLAAVATLALGIGANTAIFSLVDGILLRPLEFREPERLVAVWGRFRSPDLDTNPLSVPELEDLRRQAGGTLESITGFSPTSANLTGVDQPERIQAMVVTTNFFDVLGASPARGRTFAAEDDAGGIGTAAVITDGLWRRRFGGAPDVIGRNMRLDDDDFTVIGVMPRGFGQPGDTGPSPVEIWVPSNFRIPQLPFEQRSARFVAVIARLAPGVSRSQAQARLAGIADRVRLQNPDQYAPRAGWSLRLLPLFDQVVGNVRPALFVLLGAVGLVLLIGCANVANLSLARSAEREREIAVRAALGAGRLRVVRLLLTESLVLALLGGGLGVLLAVWGSDLLVSLTATNLPRVGEIGIDLRVLAFTLALTVLTGIAFGLIPALQMSRGDLQPALKDATRGATAGRARGRTRAFLVVAEIALALVLLVGAGLLLESFRRLLAVDPGFEPEGLLTAQVSLPVPNQPERGKYYSDEMQRTFYRQVLAELSASPGVRAAGLSSNLPLSGGSNLGAFRIEGRPVPPGEPPPLAEFRAVSPGYFRLMEIPVLAGRELDEKDRSDAPFVAVVNRALARRFWPGEDPVGRRIRIGPDGAVELTIVGVVGDVRQLRLESEPEPELYFPYEQAPSGTLTLVVRADRSPENLAPTMRAAVRAVEREQPVYNVLTMRQLLGRAVAPRRISMLLLNAFAVLALGLAAVGIYGVMAYGVAQRRREIGVRMALGAHRADVLRLVVGQGMALALAGVGVGLVAAFGLTRVLASLLYGVSRTDPRVFFGLSALLVAVALVACWLPARRASGLDPLAALRTE